MARSSVRLQSWADSSGAGPQRWWWDSNTACPSARRSGWHKLVSDYAKQMTTSLVWPPKGWFVQCANKQNRSGAVLWVHPRAHADICTDTSNGLALRAEKGQHTKAILGGVHALSNWLINTTPATRPPPQLRQPAVRGAPVSFGWRRTIHQNIRRPCPNNIWVAAPKAELMTAISIIRGLRPQLAPSWTHFQASSACRMTTRDTDSSLYFLKRYKETRLGAWMSQAMNQFTISNLVPWVRSVLATLRCTAKYSKAENSNCFCGWLTSTFVYII